MPVKIKNIFNGKVELIDIRESKNREKYPTNMWQVVAGKDIVQIYEHYRHNESLDRGEQEKRDLESILTGHPLYFFKDLPDFGNWNEFKVSEEKNQSLEPPRETGNLLPINTPKRNIIKANAAKIKPAISKALEIDYIKYTIIGIIVSVVTYFLYEYFKYKKW